MPARCPDGDAPSRSPLHSPRPPVGAVAVVAEPCHERREGIRHTSGPHPRSRWVPKNRTRAATARRHGRQVRCPREARSGPDEVAELHDRTGPAMNEHQREGIGARRPDVQEVHCLAVDLVWNCGKRLSSDSWTRQSNAVAHRSHSDRMADGSAPSDQLASGNASGQRVATIRSAGLEDLVGNPDGERLDRL